MLRECQFHECKLAITRVMPSAPATPPLSDYKSENLALLCAQRHANADFARALSDRIVHHAIYADCGVTIDL